MKETNITLMRKDVIAEQKVLCDLLNCQWNNLGFCKCHTIQIKGIKPKILPYIFPVCHEFHYAKDKMF